LFGHVCIIIMLAIVHAPGTALAARVRFEFFKEESEC
jgi:hypothetical protein